MDEELRKWRRKAHQAFDPFWKGKTRFTRRLAFKWLASEMGLPEDETHISAFSVDDCKRVIKICKEARTT